jgi:hypothetical protein
MLGLPITSRKHWCCASLFQWHRARESPERLPSSGTLNASRVPLESRRPPDLREGAQARSVCACIAVLVMIVIFPASRLLAASNPSFTKPLDSWPGATVAYSFRQLRTAYSGPSVQLRRSSDNEILDIGFTATGHFHRDAADTFCASSLCFINAWYDQSGNANTLTQTNNALQWQYVTNGSLEGNPLARCGTPPCGMMAADSASYKTPHVNAFVVVKIGAVNARYQEPNRWVIGYPQNTIGSIAVYPPTRVSWFFGNMFGDSIMGAIGSIWTSNLEGFGAAYRNRLFQYDYDSAAGIIKYNTTLWESAPVGAISYPDQIGLHVGIAGNGKNSVQGDFAEILLYAATQSARDSISSNQSSYWGISDPPASVSTPDGVKWAPVYTGNFSPDSSGGPNAGVPVTIHNQHYFTDSAWDTHSIWRATNLAGGADMMRFEVHSWDLWNDASERSELDGAASALWPRDKTVQISYAMKIEPGAAITNAAWFVLGQFLYNGKKANTPASFSFQFLNERLSMTVDKKGIAHTSPKITRNLWYNIFIEQNISSNGTDDVLKAWINGTQVVNGSGTLFPGNGGDGGYWKFGIYRGWPGQIPQSMAVRYANMEVVDKSLADLSSRITSPLAHPGVD